MSKLGRVSVGRSSRRRWQGMPIQNFINKEKVQVVGGVTGLKGAKLPMNSQFRKMNNFIKKKEQRAKQLEEDLKTLQQTAD